MAYEITNARFDMIESVLRSSSLTHSQQQPVQHLGNSILLAKTKAASNVPSALVLLRSSTCSRFLHLVSLGVRSCGNPAGKRLTFRLPRRLFCVYKVAPSSSLNLQRNLLPIDIQLEALFS
ncbi:hypothetical protein PGTUg99_027824 [Puccinia graminis f. sp. tritici]|uniref:Uncharacterized protein n=1 Tax=Puccinia graminis f. sp. tritici TaxID=56615 RepID=A0A5B0RMU0_PUCGR|nr:hypothetical protein PGTUg99_027824 [Puccinia graminis f. sp. tritici]